MTLEIEKEETNAFYFVIYSSKLIRILKDSKIALKEFDFTYNEKYREQILSQASSILEPQYLYLIDKVRANAEFTS